MSAGERSHALLHSAGGGAWLEVGGAWHGAGVTCHSRRRCGPHAGCDGVTGVGPIHRAYATDIGRV